MFKLFLHDSLLEEATILPPLLEPPYLTNLRAFKLGFSEGEPLTHSTQVAMFRDCTSQQIIELLGKCPRLEELYLNTPLPSMEDLWALPTLGNVRVMQYYFGSDYSTTNPASAYPLTLLANNASLHNLTTLRLHPGRDAAIDLEEMAAVLRSPNLPSLTHLQLHMTTGGDKGCRLIIKSGILRRLEVLDLAYGQMTDKGARLLAACPDLKHLERLDVSANALTEVGVAALQATGVRVVADEQHEAEDEDFYDVDME